MTDERFRELHAELEADAKAIAKALLDFSAKWTARMDEIATTTPEQDDEMAKAAAWLDEVLSTLP